MVPLDGKARDRVWKSDDAPHRSLALSHATLHDRPGLRGNDPEHPTSVVWLREGDEGVFEAFAAGVPGPVLDWIAAHCRRRPVALLAPASWEGSVRARGGRVESSDIQTWIGYERPTKEMPSNIQVRRLDLADEPAFASIAPAWAQRSWGDFATLIERGIAFGVPSGDGFASLAWTYESDLTHDKVGVFTVPRFRRLSLSRRVASSLLDAINLERRRHPVWVTTPANTASIALARSLGFTIQVTETLLRWTPE